MTNKLSAELLFKAAAVLFLPVTEKGTLERCARHKHQSKYLICLNVLRRQVLQTQYFIESLVEWFADPSEG